MTTIDLEAVQRLDRDIREAARELSDREARYLVDAYYVLQEHRIEAQNQVRAMTASEEPNAVLGWLFDQNSTLEAQVKAALGKYADAQRPGRWALSVTGIGPVLAAGLLAHIDIEKAPTVGHIWRFAGLDPTVKWEKGQKRPWNASLKVLCWKIGESFVKVSGNERDVYGKVYVARKELEVERNEAGLFADQAERSLAEKKFGAATDARKWYEQGKLPPARIHARAKRYAVKLFLSHYHHAAFESRFGEAPPKPYIFTSHAAVAGDHVHYVAPPGWPID